MYKITSIRYLINKDDIITDDKLVNYCLKILNKEYHIIPTTYELIKKSLDARHQDLYYELSLAFDSDKILDKYKNNKYNISIYNKERDINLDLLLNSNNNHQTKIVIVGMGPAGLFSAWGLTQAGYDVTIIEQGSKVEERIKDIDRFQNNNELNSYSNIHFGEGGAGTFSDGKLQTGVTSPLIRYIFETFVSCGASNNILYETLPHIGTDVLREVIINMREKLLEMGCKINYHQEVYDFDDNKVYSKDVCNNNLYEYNYDKLVVATGHSGYKVYEMLNNHHAKMEQKNFAVGVRIEHLQSDINKALYHGEYQHLPAANYKLVSHLSNGRSCYSFCMCPGGYVVNASSTNNQIVTNGMSYHARDGINSNAAILVNIDTKDYDHGNIFDGIKFQQDLEKLCYNPSYPNYAPVSLLGDFIKHDKTTKLGNIQPTIKPGYYFENLWKILPKYVCDTICDSIEYFNKKIPGFNNPDAVLTCAETRTSSACYVIRDKETLESFIKNVYVIGEGSGYSGGITTSAIDGLKTAIIINNKTKGE